MRITAVTTAVVESVTPWTIVRIDTDDGLHGYGECFYGPAVSATARELGELLIGRDPCNIGPLVRRLRLVSAPSAGAGGTSYHAISGIEIALHDLAGKALGVPVWQLLGGRFRSKVRLYADCHAGDFLQCYSGVLQPRTPTWADRFGQTMQGRHVEYEPDAYAAQAKAVVEDGYTAIKFDLDLPRVGQEDRWGREISPAKLERQVAIAEAVCAAVPADVDVAFDCHWQYAPADALKLARGLEHLPVLWLEDPVPPDDIAGLAAVTTRTSTRIASGENRYLLNGFVPMFEAGAVDVVTPDIPKVGGLREAMHIAALADARSLPMAPHNITGPVGTVASAHMCAAIPNFLVLEWHGAGIPFFEDLVAGEAPFISEGGITVSDAPGLGIDLDLEACRRYAWPGEPFFEGAHPSLD